MVSCIELHEFESGLVLTTQPPNPHSPSPTAFPPPLSHHHSEAIPTVVPGLRRGVLRGCGPADDYCLAETRVRAGDDPQSPHYNTHFPTEHRGKSCWGAGVCCRLGRGAILAPRRHGARTPPSPPPPQNPQRHRLLARESATGTLEGAAAQTLSK